MRFQSPSGMHDLFEETLKYFELIEETCQKVAVFYGFKKIEPPILEETALFERSTGASTEIVQKQMFSFRTRGGDHLSLRPEITPSIVRAYIEHGMRNLAKPVKLWYFGPVFRHERPQAGRYRQFYQAGFESLGVKSPVIDAQIIQIFYDILQELGFRNLTVEVNSIGDWQCRPYYKKTLLNYLRSFTATLCLNCKRRLRENPLRVLDCKQEKCQRVAKGAPPIINHLCKECHQHFKQALEFLEGLDLPYQLNPYLVRGLDYYSKTVFEISEDSKEGQSQGALLGGGRYDGLVKILGGEDAPACGGALGVERIANLLKLKAKKVVRDKPPLLFLAQVGDLAKGKGLKLFEEFRRANIKVAETFWKDSLSSQLKIADKLGVRYTLILGQKEALQDKIIVREMKSGKQKTISLQKIVKEMKRKIKK